MEIEGTHNTKKYIPHMLGREASGEVVNIGNKVTKVKVGQKVILSWIKGKGETMDQNVITKINKN